MRDEGSAGQDYNKQEFLLAVPWLFVFAVAWGVVYRLQNVFVLAQCW